MAQRMLLGLTMTTDKHNTVTRPGKYEGEPTYVEYLRETVMEPDETLFDGDTPVDVFRISAKDVAAFEDLRGVDVVILWKDSQGFCWSRELTNSELASLRSELENAAGPQEEDITTEDHRQFYYLGKCIVDVEDADDWRPAVGAWCKAHGYFPNVWFISDHGNAHLISVSENGRYLAGHADDNQ